MKLQFVEEDEPEAKGYPSDEELRELADEILLLSARSSVADGESLSSQEVVERALALAYDDATGMEVER